MESQPIIDTRSTSRRSCSLFFLRPILSVWRLVSIVFRAAVAAGGTFLSAEALASSGHLQEYNEGSGSSVGGKPMPALKLLVEHAEAAYESGHPLTIVTERVDRFGRRYFADASAHNESLKDTTPRAAPRNGRSVQLAQQPRVPSIVNSSISRRVSLISSNPPLVSISRTVLIGWSVSPHPPAICANTARAMDSEVGNTAGRR
jgi:hypothetical protein